jgi:hypothetical protein
MEGTHMTQPIRSNRFADEVRLAATLTPAVPRPVPVSRTTATADSSGFVDLSDFSETDGNWVDRALTQARNGGRAVPASIAPVAMESLARPTETRPRNDSALGAIVFVAVCVAVAAAGIASAVVVVRARNEKPETATAAIAAMTVTAPSAARDPSADALATPSAAAAPADSAPSTIAARPAKNPAKKPAFGGRHAQPAYAAAAPRSAAPAAGARRPASSGGSGSFDDMIRRAAMGKGGH